jgi:hypothetical protein
MVVLVMTMMPVAEPQYDAGAAVAIVAPAALDPSAGRRMTVQVVGITSATAMVAMGFLHGAGLGGRCRWRERRCTRCSDESE